MTLDVGLVAILVTVILTIIALSFGYGILTQKVTDHSKRQDELDKQFKTIDDKLDKVCGSVQALEAIAQRYWGRKED